jgi:hypothetical protein
MQFHDEDACHLFEIVAFAEAAFPWRPGIGNYKFGKPADARGWPRGRRGRAELAASDIRHAERVVVSYEVFCVDDDLALNGPSGMIEDLSRLNPRAAIELHGGMMHSGDLMPRTGAEIAYLLDAAHEESVLRHARNNFAVAAERLAEVAATADTRAAWARGASGSGWGGSALTKFEDLRAMTVMHGKGVGVIASGPTAIFEDGSEIDPVSEVEVREFCEYGPSWAVDRIEGAPVRLSDLGMRLARALPPSLGTPEAMSRANELRSGRSEAEVEAFLLGLLSEQDECIARLSREKCGEENCRRA